MSLSPKEIKRRCDVLLSAQNALVGMVPPHLQAVLVDWKEPEITFYFLYLGKPSETDQEDIKKVVQQVHSDLSQDTIKTKTISLDQEGSFPQVAGETIFCRKGVHWR